MSKKDKIVFTLSLNAPQSDNKCVALPNILVNDVKCSCNGKIRQCFLSMLLHDAQSVGILFCHFQALAFVAELQQNYFLFCESDKKS